MTTIATLYFVIGLVLDVLFLKGTEGTNDRQLGTVMGLLLIPFLWPLMISGMVQKFRRRGLG